MNRKMRSSDLLKFSAAACCACLLALGAWLWLCPTHYRSTVVLIGSQQQSDPAANAYVRSAPGNEQIATLLISDPNFDQLLIPALKPSPHLWLHDHLHVRSVQGNRVEIIAKARTYEASALEMDSLIAFATEILVADAARNGLVAKAVTTMRTGG